MICNHETGIAHERAPTSTTYRGVVYGRMEPKYPEGGHWLTPSGVILINSVETAAPFNLVTHLIRGVFRAV